MWTQAFRQNLKNCTLDDFIVYATKSAVKAEASVYPNTNHTL